jgi:HEAT repeat protein
MKKLLLASGAVMMLGLCQCCGPTARQAPAGEAKPQPKIDKKELLKRFLKDLDSKDDNVRLSAIIELSDYGPQAEPAIAGLITSLGMKNEDIRLNAAIVLGKIGKSAVPAVTEQVNSDDVDIRYYALSALGWIGPDAKDAAPAVIKSLAHKNESVRRKATYTLGVIAPGPKTIPVLIAAFSDTNEDVRQAAAEATAKVGGDAVKPLIDALGHMNPTVRLQATRALGDIGSDAKDAIPHLRTLLVEEDKSAQQGAAEALGKIGKESIPTLTEALKSTSAVVRRLAVDALGKVGAVAVPELVDALGAGHVDVRRQAAVVLGPMRVGDKMVVLGFAFALKDEDEQVRQHSAHGLQILGPLAKLGAPALREALVDSNFNVRQTAFYALQSMNEDPRSGLRKGLDHKDKKVRINTASLMATMGIDHNQAVPILVDALKEKDLTLQMQAAHALAQSRREAKSILPILKGGLKNPSVGVRGQAIQALMYMGDQAKSIAPDLLDVFTNDTEAKLKQQALQALQNIGGDPAVMVPAFEKHMKGADPSLRLSIVQTLWRYGAPGLRLIIVALDDSDANVRQQAVWALQSVQGDVKSGLVDVVPLLKHKDTNVRSGVVQLLGRMGEDAVPHLLAVLKDGNNSIRWTAVHSLANQRTAHKKVIPILADMATKDKSEETKTFAVQALARFGPESFPTLLDLLKSQKNDNVRATVMQTLGSYHAHAKTVVPHLIEALKDKSPQVRWSAANGISNMGGHAKSAVPALRETLKDENPTVRIHAVYALCNMGPDGLPGMIDAVNLKDDNLRLTAMQHLQNYGAKAKEAVQGLIGALKSTNANVRWTAATTLGNIGPDAKAAIPALTDALQDTNPTVRQQAQTAIQQIQRKG